MQQDIVFLVNWWLVISCFGVINIPLTWLIFNKFVGFGYGFSKTLGILLASFVVFILSTFHLIPFNLANTYFSLLVLSSANFYILYKFKEKIFRNLLKSWKVIVFQEILFGVGLVGWSLIRGYQPDINGLEKFMDYGFINSLLRSKYLPPYDMWFAGRPINYYWYGHFITAFLTKLSGIPSFVTYNLMLATILGLGLTSSFSISSSLVKSLRSKISKRYIFAAGIISAFLLVFGGNFHTPFFVLKNGAKNYWYPDATRFIGYNPETQDKTIHEFPIYSFVVSDLHAHLLNFPIVLLYIALLFRLIRKKGINTYDFLITGFVLGIVLMTNAWDFANYSLTTGFVLLLTLIKRLGLKTISLIKVALETISITVIGLLTATPFLLNFDSIAQGVALVKARTPLWQLSILWGFPALLTFIFLLTVHRLWPKLKKPDIFVAAILISSWTLILLPEIIYVKDIYVASHHRANTMFKLTYQAFVMFYLSSGYITVRSLHLVKKWFFKIPLLTFYLFIFFLILWYPSFAINSYYGDLKQYKGLSGETWLKNSYPDLYQVVLWLRKNAINQPTILEAPGDSYTEYDVVSSYTGLPTVSGWFVHEWLWRGSSEIPQERVSEISEIYTSQDLSKTKALLNKYKVRFIIVGDFERERFPNLKESKFKQLGEIVYSSGNTRLYKLN